MASGTPSASRSRDGRYHVRARRGYVAQLVAFVPSSFVLRPSSLAPSVVTDKIPRVSLVGAVGLSAAGSLGGLAAASLLLLLPAATRTRLVPPLASYAVGALLGVALVAMLPEAIAMAPARPRVRHAARRHPAVSSCSKLLLWRHCHSDSCAVHGASGPLVLIGGAVHNFIDGALIGASLVTSDVARRECRHRRGRARSAARDPATSPCSWHAGYSRSRARSTSPAVSPASSAP